MKKILLAVALIAATSHTLADPIVGNNVRGAYGFISDDTIEADSTSALALSVDYFINDGYFIQVSSLNQTFKVDVFEIKSSSMINRLAIGTELPVSTGVNLFSSVGFDLLSAKTDGTALGVSFSTKASGTAFDVVGGVRARTGDFLSEISYGYMFGELDGVSVDGGSVNATTAYDLGNSFAPMISVRLESDAKAFLFGAAYMF